MVSWEIGKAVAFEFIISPKKDRAVRKEGPTNNGAERSVEEFIGPMGLGRG